MEERFEERRFSRDEIGELIETATRLDQLRADGEGLDIDALRQVAAEIGVSEEALEAALDERLADERNKQRERDEAANRDAEVAQHEEARRNRRSRQLNEWRAGLASYVGVMAGLAAFDWFPDRSFDWVWWPAAGWGIAIAIQTFHVLFGVEDKPR